VCVTYVCVCVCVCVCVRVCVSVCMHCLCDSSMMEGDGGFRGRKLPVQLWVCCALMGLFNTNMHAHTNT